MASYWEIMACFTRGADFLRAYPTASPFFHGRGRFKEGLRAEGLTELIDIVFTILEAAGFEVLDDIQGCSLYPDCNR